MRRDVAQEPLDTGGWCPMEGKGLGGSKRAHDDAAYAICRTPLIHLFASFLHVGPWPLICSNFCCHVCKVAGDMNMCRSSIL
jgi:hypothetical protein